MQLRLALWLLLLTFSLTSARLNEHTKLWNFDERESGRILRERRLLQHDYSSAKYRALKSPSLFEFGKEALTSLKDGDFVSFDIPTSKVSSTARRRNSQTPEDITKHCQLSSSIPGVPSSVSVKTPSLKLFTCKPKELEEFHFVFDTSVASGGMWGTYFSADGHTYFIDQAFNDSDTYLVYDSRELVLAANQNEISVEPLHETVFSTDNYDISTDIESSGRKLSLEEREERRRQLQSGDPNAFIFRIVILTSEEVSRDLNRRTLSEMSSFLIQLITRVNGVLIREFGVFFELTNNFQNAICLDKVGTCGTVLNTVTNRPFTRDQLEELGFPPSTYDLGHFIHTSGTGGQANLKALCSPNEAVRAGGASDLNRNFVAVDTFFLNQFAHEVAHQFGVDHTWRDCINFQRQFNDETGVEPGGGTTIMGFHGVCGGQTNLANAADPYYNTVALQKAKEEIREQVIERDCGVVRNPSIGRSTLTVAESCRVPLGNNFRLLGKSSSSQSSGRFFSWERVDPGVETLTDNQLGRFRSYKPVSVRDRFFPNLHFLNFQVFPRFEALPTTPRQMEFSFTERRLYDTNAQASNFANGIVGDFTVANTVVKFENAQAFAVTSPSNGASIEVNGGVRLNFRQGGLGARSLDGKARIFYAEHTMSPVAQDFNFDSERDLEQLDWELVGEAVLSSGVGCFEISRDETNLGDGGNGILLIQANTNEAEGSSVSDDFGCFVFEVVTGISLVERVSESSCDPAVLAFGNGGGGLSGGGKFFLVLLLLSSIGAVLGVAYYKKRKDGTLPKFSVPAVSMPSVSVPTVSMPKIKSPFKPKTEVVEDDDDMIAGPKLGVITQKSLIGKEEKTLPVKKSAPSASVAQKKSKRKARRRKTSLSIQDFGGKGRISVKRGTEISQELIDDDLSDVGGGFNFSSQAKSLGRAIKNKMSRSRRSGDSSSEEEDEENIVASSALKQRLQQLNFGNKTSSKKQDFKRKDVREAKPNLFSKGTTFMTNAASNFRKTPERANQEKDVIDTPHMTTFATPPRSKPASPTFNKEKLSLKKEKNTWKPPTFNKPVQGKSSTPSWMKKEPSHLTTSQVKTRAALDNRKVGAPNTPSWMNKRKTEKKAEPHHLTESEIRTQVALKQMRSGAPNTPSWKTNKSEPKKDYTPSWKKNTSETKKTNYTPSWKTNKEDKGTPSWMKKKSEKKESKEETGFSALRARFEKKNQNLEEDDF